MNKIHLFTLFSIFTLLFTSPAAYAGSEVYDINSPLVKKIADQFSMQGHAEHDLATCSTMQIYYSEIAELLNEGMTEQEVIDYYYGMYGEEGLRVPKKEGFSLTAWVTPFAVLGVASIALFFGLRNIISRRKEHFGLEIDTQEVEDEIVKSMIDEERKKYF